MLLLSLLFIGRGKSLPHLLLPHSHDITVVPERRFVPSANVYDGLVITGDEEAPDVSILDALRPSNNVFVGMMTQEDAARHVMAPPTNVVHALHTNEELQRRFRSFVWIQPTLHSEVCRVHCGRWSDFLRVIQATCPTRIL